MIIYIVVSFIATTVVTLNSVRNRILVQLVKSELVHSADFECMHNHSLLVIFAVRMKNVQWEIILKA